MNRKPLPLSECVINIAPILPVKYLELSKDFHYHLILAHKVLENPRYASFYRKRSAEGDFVVLDNSCYELGHPIETSKLLLAAEIVNPDAIVSPDVLYDAEATLAKFKEFSEQMSLRLPNAYIVGVPQGDSLSSYIKCYSELQRYADIMGLTFIGIDKILKDVPLTYKRVVMLDILNSKVGLYKPIHALGIADNPIEVKLLANSPHNAWIMSNDSSSAFIHGAANIVFDFVTGMRTPKIKEKMNFEIESISPAQVEIVKDNLQMLQRYSYKAQR